MQGCFGLRLLGCVMGSAENLYRSHLLTPIRSPVRWFAIDNVPTVQPAPLAVGMSDPIFDSAVALLGFGQEPVEMPIESLLVVGMDERLAGQGLGLVHRIAERTGDLFIDERHPPGLRFDERD